MKNRYLTDLATKNRLWHIPVGLLSILLSSVTAQVWIEDSPFDEDPAIWLLAHMTVMALWLLPLFRIVLWRLRQHSAKVIAQKLARRREHSIPLSELSGLLGVKRAGAKITKLKRLGFLQRVEIENGELVLDNPKLEVVADKARPQARPDDVIQEICRLNDEIDDAAVSERIDRIEAVTASILCTLRERPDRADDARRFMDYYLPTTLKLLESYNLMEDQSYQGESIQAARRSIEAVLDKLVSATEKQQDKLFGSEALDVETEIDVLEKMMASDGLIAGKDLRQTSSNG